MKQLDPRAVWLFFVRFIGIWFWLGVVIGVMVGTVALDDTSGTINTFFKVIIGNVLLSIFPIVVGCWIWARLSWKFYRYELREEAFRKEHGVILKKYVSIPYERIQNVDIYRGIISRILGLSDVHIQTAGMSAPMGKYGFGTVAEGRLPGLDSEEAERLRDELIERARRNEKQGL
jgi:membrane protein YdbS with pleckstrin-like domain